MKIRLKPKRKKPDWENPDDYNSMNDLNMSQWAWEFLKRNPKYIKEWERLTKGLTEKEKQNPLWAAAMGKAPGLLDAFQWGLPHGYLNPDINFEYGEIPFIPLGGKETDMIIPGHQKHSRFLGFPDYETGHVLFDFNFNEPIIPQIKEAKKRLLKLQKESKEKGNRTRQAFKPRRDEYILLIRILDVKAVGAKDKEIARVLFPKEYSPDTVTDVIKKVHDKRKQAERYVNQDYRLIPYSEE